MSRHNGYTAQEWHDMCEEAVDAAERLDALLLRSLANERKVRKERDEAEAEIRSLLDFKELVRSHLENRTLTYRDCFTRICEEIEAYDNKETTND